MQFSPLHPADSQARLMSSIKTVFFFMLLKLNKYQIKNCLNHLVALPPIKDVMLFAIPIQAKFPKGKQISRSPTRNVEGTGVTKRIKLPQAIKLTVLTVSM